ncbi:MAG: hypothetical protein LIO90_06985 [Bacteroidales bacterium]|nr:hypothetical protein [Bacteroidales bacterium]
MFQRINSMIEMEQRAIELGFLPFFSCGIPGFSIEEMIAPELWFSDENDGPWEWKGPMIKEGHCAYGKIFNKKAGFVSLEWLPDLINYRRSKPLAHNEDVAALDDIVLQTIQSEGSVTIKELRRLLSFARGRGKRKNADELVDALPHDQKISLEPILVRLMMELRIVIADFEYNIDRHGHPYGWGIARYTTPETLYGSLRIDRTPEESFLRILNHFKTLFPGAPDKVLLKLISGKSPLC